MIWTGKKITCTLHEVQIELKILFKDGFSYKDICELLDVLYLVLFVTKELHVTFLSLMKCM